MSRLALLVIGTIAGFLSAAGVPPSHHEWARKAQGRHAYGVYFKDRKVGWVVEEMKLGKHNGADVMLSLSETYMKTLFDKEESVKHEKTTTAFELAGRGDIAFADFYRKEDGKVVTRRIERDGGRLKIVTKQGGRTLTRRVPMPKDTIAHHRELEAWLAGPRKAGEKFTSYSAAWEEDDVNTKNVYRFREAKTMLVGDQSRQLYSVEIDLDGGKMEALVFPDSRIVTATIGGLMKLKLEKEEDAKKLDGKPVDLMPITAVYVEEHLGLARHVDVLRLELRGLGDFQVPASHRQVVTAGKECVVVELRRDFRAEKASPLTDKEKIEYTKATPRLQSDEEQVKNLARKIVGEEKDALKAARKIERWVHENLTKSYSDNADTALEILDRKAGDCTEHSLLFVALARAAGIPAREVGGLAYVPDKKPMFGWHAWAEVHDGHQWVSIDPTWGQVYVDGTHLKMSTGDRDLAWTNVMGTLKMKVADVKKRR
jgi:hypothetical protein